MENFLPNTSSDILLWCKVKIIFFNQYSFHIIHHRFFYIRHKYKYTVLFIRLNHKIALPTETFLTRSWQKISNTLSLLFIYILTSSITITNIFDSKTTI
jgi:prepilin signal peptidase PulO-like enzyme (type II secretory pathway)